MRPSHARHGGLCILLASAGLADAQPPPSPTPRERTGPAATPPPLPSWAEPKPDPVVPQGREAEPIANDERRLTRIEVTGEGPTGRGIPPPGWQPPDASTSGLRLDHRPGEALDADWVRRQFALNALPARDGHVSAAVALVQLLNRAFATAGFVNSGVIVSDPSKVTDGVLELRLVQGSLGGTGSAGKLAVTFVDGRSKGLSERFVRRRFPSADERPLSAVAFERDFRLLAENSAIRTINADLRPGERPGEASLHVLVQPARRADLVLSFANDRAPSVGSERLSAAGYLRNGLASGDLLSAEIGYTSGVEDAVIDYSAPLVTPRTRLTLRGSLNNAAVIDRPLLPLDIHTKDRMVEGGLVHRFIEAPLTPGATAGAWTPSRTLSMGVLFAYRQQKSFLFGEPFSFAPGSKDGRSRYGAARLTADYVLRGVDQVLAVSATGSIGLGGTRADQPEILDPDRNFLVALVQANYARRLGPEGLELRARLAGQLASSVLYSGERFGIGGQTTVRGYRENVLLVDKGAIGSIELAWSFSLAGSESGRRRFDWARFSLSAFADAAIADNVEAQPPPRSFIAGAGLSLAWTPSDAILLSVARGEALRDLPRVGSRDLQDRGWHFRLTVRPFRLF